LFLLKGEDFTLDFGAYDFNFLSNCDFFKINRVIAIINVELMLEMVFELKNLLFNFMVFGSHLSASIAKDLILLRGDRSRIRKWLIELSNMMGVINLMELQEIA
jgi:hypothetical protein